MYLYNSSQHCILIITSTFWIPNGVKQKHNHKIPWIYKVPFPPLKELTTVFISICSSVFSASLEVTCFNAFMSQN